MRIGRDVLDMDLYGILGVQPGASAVAIRRAYRRQVMNSHPDLFPHRRTRTERRMVELNIAATILLEPARRAEYDLGRALGSGVSPRTPGRWRVSPGGGYVWPAPAAPAAAVADDWSAPARASGIAGADRELTAALDSLRQWPGRLLQAIGGQTDGWSPRTHALFTFATVGLAFLLIAAARPRSLPMFEDGAKTASHRARSAQPG